MSNTPGMIWWLALRLGIKGHPGVPVVAMITACSFVVGLGKGGLTGGLLVAGIMSVFWIPVFLTAYSEGKRQLKRK